MGRQVLTTPWLGVALVTIVGCRSEINPAYCVGHADPRCPDGGGGDTLGSGNPLCFGTGIYKVCLDALPANTIQISSDVDTTSSSLCAPAQPTGWTAAGQREACFVIAKTIEIMGGNVNATGARPLVLVASDSLTIDDDLDLSAKADMATYIPAGFDPAACGPFARATVADNGGASGGAGGSLGTKGGDGGAGNNTTADLPGLAAEALAMPGVLHGGCIGQDGGIGDQPPTAPGGNGGGALYAVSPAITLGASAKITASGAGGSAGGHHYGGGGGGSGGMIVMVSTMFTINTSAVVIANGGGGASGGNGGAGMKGNDPSTSNPTQVANGGGGAGHGPGGNGYAGGTAATAGQPTGGSGGGGGGGGGGFVVANQAITGAMASPPPTIVAF